MLGNTLYGVNTMLKFPNTECELNNSTTGAMKSAFHSTWSLKRLHKLAVDTKHPGSTSPYEADDVVVVVVDFMGGVADG